MVITNLCVFFNISLQTTKELKTKIESQMNTCIRAGHTVSRLCEAYNQRVSADGLNIKKNSFMAYFETGEQCSIAGFGEQYDKFKEQGHFELCLPAGITLKKYDDPDFEVARFREINFDETYPGMPYDCRRSKNFIRIIFLRWVITVNILKL